VPYKSLNHTFIRFFGLRFFSRPEPERDKIVWSVRFRLARRTSVRRKAKSGAEKAKTLNTGPFSVIAHTLKLDNISLFSLFRSGRF